MTTITKTYVLDTNVLLSDSNALFSFEEHDIVIPLIVIEELDRHKDRQDEVGRNARETARKLSELLKGHSNLHQNPIKLITGGKLFVYSTDFLGNYKMAPELDPKSGDNQIIAFCKSLQETVPNLILVSRDLLLRLKGEAMGIPCQDYKKFSVATSANTLYNGVKTLVGSYDVDTLYASEKLRVSEFLTPEDIKSLYPNQLLVCKQEGTDKSVLAKYTGTEVRAISSYSPCKIEGRNKEQKFAIDLLLDPSIKLVTIVGSAGTGKSLLSIAAGLHLVLDTKKYKSLVVCRPIQPMGKDIGFLPGDIREKLEPWIAPIKDNLRYLLSADGKKTKRGEETLEMLFENGTIEVEAMTFIRGRSIANAYMIIDECFPSNQTVSVEGGKEKIGILWKKFQQNQPLPHALSFDHENQTFSFKKITNVYRRGKKALAEVRLSNRIIRCTQNHPFLLIDKGYTPVSELSPGDLVVTTLPSSRSQLLRSWNEDQEQVVLGSYLGDGRIAGHGKNRFRLKVLHGINQQAYCKHKASVLNSKTKLIPVNGYNKTPAIQFSTKMFGSKTPFAKKKSSCPQEILDKLNLKGLAIWFMDDGTVFTHKNGAKLFTCSFDEDSHNRFLSYFHSLGMTGVKVQQDYVSNKKKSYPCLVFSATDYRTLSSLIEPYMHPELAYKAANPANVGTYTWNSKEPDFGLTVVDKVTMDIGVKEEVYDLEIADHHNFVVCSQMSSMNNSGVVVHNSQNLNVHELKTIITRVGEGTKIVLTGDIEQIDNNYVDSVSNGLSVAIEKFKEYSLSGHVTLIKGERSELASLAARIL